MILGITGGTGCGKTTLLEMIRQAGGLVLDCDAIYHELLKTDKALLTAIETRFPGTVEDGVLQRKKLGAVVFSDPAALEDLNRITHSAIKAKVEALLQPPPALAAIDAIALVESGLDTLCDVTVAIVASRAVQAKRIMARDGVTEAYALARIDAQPTAADFAAKCDYTLENNDTLDAFQSKCLAFLNKLAIIKENDKGEFL